MIAQMKSETFDNFDPIPVFGLFWNFELACDTNGIHEGVATWHCNFLMEKSESIVLSAALVSKARGSNKDPIYWKD